MAFIVLNLNDFRQSCISFSINCLFTSPMFFFLLSSLLSDLLSLLFSPLFSLFLSSSFILFKPLTCSYALMNCFKSFILFSLLLASLITFINSSLNFFICFFSPVIICNIESLLLFLLLSINSKLLT